MCLSDWPQHGGMMLPLRIDKGLFDGGVSYGVEGGAAGLGVLEGAGDGVEAAVFEKVGAGLVETEGDARGEGLAVQVEDPVEVECAGVFAGLASDRNLLYQGGIEIRGKVYVAEQRRGDDKSVANRQ